MHGSAPKSAFGDVLFINQDIKLGALSQEVTLHRLIGRFHNAHSVEYFWLGTECCTLYPNLAHKGE